MEQARTRQQADTLPITLMPWVNPKRKRTTKQTHPYFFRHEELQDLLCSGIIKQFENICEDDRIFISKISYNIALENQVEKKTLNF